MGYPVLGQTNYLYCVSLWAARVTSETDGISPGTTNGGLGVIKRLDAFNKIPHAPLPVIVGSNIKDVDSV
jgi:hypothetical protein